MNKGWLIIVLYFLSTVAFAHPAGVYPEPPPNDTSLSHHQPKLSHAKPCAAKISKYHRHHKAHYKKHAATGLFVYYALPATACCGENWELGQVHCCADSGRWHTSPYATFKAGTEDLIYSATNDDAYRSYDIDHSELAEREIDDPAYY